MGTNACDDVFGWADRDPGRAMFAVQADGGWQPVTAAQIAERAGAVAAGLIASGIKPGDRVGLMAPTSLEWVMCDFAIWAAGAVTVPIYEASSAEQINWGLSDSGAVAVFAGNARLAEAIHGAQPAKVEARWRLDAGGLDALTRAGQSVEGRQVARRRAAVTAETLATIVYISGTAGRTKDCMISHGTQRLFAAAEATAMAWSRAGRRAGTWLRLRHAAFGRPVYARLRKALGGRVAWVISGGAPLDEDLGHFFHGAGLTVMEGWGMTETVGPIIMNRPAVQRIGSVGLPLPSCQVRATADGELEVQGPDVFQGYWQDPQDTSDAFDGRWLRTGDLGHVDDDGWVYVTGRKKEILITAGGQHVVPSVLEDKVREHWLIAECVVAGDRRPYVVALITLDEEAFARWKQRQGKPASATIGELRDDPDLRAVVQQAVDRANATVSRPETIKRFRILPGQFEVGAELTPTGKVRRDYVLAKYASDIDALYRGPGPAVPPDNR